MYHTTLPFLSIFFDMIAKAPQSPKRTNTIKFTPFKHFPVKSAAAAQLIALSCWIEQCSAATMHTKGMKAMKA
jgi:hypothetical protein